MKTLMLLLALMIPALAEDWTVNGKDYHNVKVGQVEADRVHITYDGGIGAVMLSDLPPDLKKRFNYDPQAAEKASQQKESAMSQADADQARKIAINALQDKIADEQAALDKAPRDESYCIQQIPKAKNQTQTLDTLDQLRATRNIEKTYPQQIAADKAALAKLQGISAH